MEYRIREIESRDNKIIEGIIRDCLTEYGAAHEGTAWADPDLGRFSEIYNTEGRKYWVAENETGEVVGGVGIGELPGVDGICELQKMYCVPKVRGTGVSHLLIKEALDFAKKYYSQCYLETFGNMIAAQKFYEKYDFKRIADPIGATGHFACDIRYLKTL